LNPDCVGIESDVLSGELVTSLIGALNCVGSA